MKWFIGFLAFLCLMGTAICFYIQQKQIDGLYKQITVLSKTVPGKPKPPTGVIDRSKQ